jgi:hypothetical protein
MLIIRVPALAISFDYIATAKVVKTFLITETLTVIAFSFFLLPSSFGYNFRG